MTSAYHFPDLPASSVDTAGLGPAEAGLAREINHWTHARWLTLEHLLTRCCKRPVARLEPKLRAVLLTAGAQLLFIDRLPVYAVIDEAVELAKRRVRGGAAGLTNAALHRLAAVIGRDTSREGASFERTNVVGAEGGEESERDGGRGETANSGDASGWRPARDVLPVPAGVLELAEPWLPHADNHVAHLAAACSVPEALVRDWIDRHGFATTLKLAHHAVLDPPTFVWPGTSADESARLWQPGDGPVSAWLAADPRRRVQDPGSARAMSLLDRLDAPPATVLDYCAGRGTKTRQLTARYARAAAAGADADAGAIDQAAGAADTAASTPVRITATDADAARFADLAAWAAAYHDHRSDDPTAPRVEATDPEAALRGDLREGTSRRYALVLLDVPCSNTGVLARRPEARYRFGRAAIEQLVALQREVVEAALPSLAEGGHLLYVTCSIDPRENEEQVAWIAQRAGLSLVAEHRLLPSDQPGAAYHDGGYAALLKR